MENNTTSFVTHTDYSFMAAYSISYVILMTVSNDTDSRFMKDISGKVSYKKKLPP